MTEPSEEIKKLREEILRHEKLYYVLDRPEISDSEFDSLINRLKDLEKRHPGLITPDSPTQRVGGEYLDIFAPVEHDPPMLSIDNAYSKEEFLDWVKRTRKTVGAESTYVVEPKIDGLSCSVEYKDGLFFRASTRGDGKTGEDVTPNVKTIRNLPLKLAGEGAPREFEVRGEVYIDKKDFENLRRAQIENGYEPFANPRNAAAGSLRQKNPEIAARRNLKFQVHSMGKTSGRKFNDHFSHIAYCRRLSLPAPEINRLCRSPGEALEFYDEYFSKRADLPYEIDGIVIKVNDFAQREILGNTAKSPRWAIALKYPARRAATRITDIVYSVGRTGTITPVAKLEPVECGGVRISSATLHNFDEICRLDVRKGDAVLVERAGEVIPKIVRVVPGERKGDSQKPLPPEKCPVCLSPAVREKEGVAFKCSNPLCPAQVKKSVLHFASKSAMDIEGMGEVAVEQLVDRGVMRTYADIYNVGKDDLLKLNLFKDKKAENLLRQISESKKKPLSRFIYALGIKHVGEKAAETLANHFGDLDSLAKAQKSELEKISEIGPVMADSIRKFFQNPEIEKVIAELKKAGINPRNKKAAKSEKFKGLSFVFTGELVSMSRKNARERVKKMGGDCPSGVSAKTSFLVRGKNPGSKLKKAETLGIKTLSEKEFLEMLSGS